MAITVIVFVPTVCNKEAGVDNEGVKVRFPELKLHPAVRVVPFTCTDVIADLQVALSVKEMLNAASTVALTDAERVGGLGAGTAKEAEVQEVNPVLVN